MLKRCLSVAVGVLVTATALPSAHAQKVTQRDADDGKAAPADRDGHRLIGPAPKPKDQEPIDSNRERELPDYDGRGDEPTDAGDVAIWVPRILFSPLYLISEYVIRRPLGALVTAAEKNKWPEKAADFFSFGPGDNIHIVPTGLIDFGFRPSIGLSSWWNDFIAEDNTLKARAATGGVDWLRLTLADELPVGVDGQFGVRTEYLVRPDQLFYGIGPERPNQRYRFQIRQWDSGIGYGTKIYERSDFRSWSFVRRVSFDPTVGSGSGDRLASGIASGDVAEPPGLDGYTVLKTGFEADWDSRGYQRLHSDEEGSDFVGANQSGVRFAGRVEHAGGLQRSPRDQTDGGRFYGWVSYGGRLTGFLDLGAHRVVGLSAIADFVEPLGDPQIPFIEQVTLGGDRPMRGFLQYGLIGRSAAVAELKYEYPVWVWLNGEVIYSVGNVFGEQLRGFELERMRQSFTFGFAQATDGDNPFELLIGFGTDTFAAGAEPDEFRLVLGATNGF